MKNIDWKPKKRVDSQNLYLLDFNTCINICSNMYWNTLRVFSFFRCYQTSSKQIRIQFWHINIGIRVSRSNTWDQIMCFLFPLNSLRFSFTRESDTKITRLKSWVICKKSLLDNKIYSSIVHKKAVWNLDIWLFLLWEKMWENWEEIRNT